MEKGDLVIVHAVVIASYGSPLGGELIHEPELEHRTKKRLFRFEICPFPAVMVGTSYRATGYYYPGHTGSGKWFDDDMPEPAHLSEDKRHPVIMVQPLDCPRWLKPSACLERDLEKMEA